MPCTTHGCMCLITCMHDATRGSAGVALPCTTHHDYSQALSCMCNVQAPTPLMQSSGGAETPFHLYRAKKQRQTEPQSSMMGGQTERGPGNQSTELFTGNKPTRHLPVPQHLGLLVHPSHLADEGAEEQADVPVSCPPSSPCLLCSTAWQRLRMLVQLQTCLLQMLVTNLGRISPPGVDGYDQSAAHHQQLHHMCFHT